MSKQINPEMLLLARKRRRITQKNLATETGIPQAEISRVENGLKNVLSHEEIQLIARSLKFPTNFFFEQEPFYKNPLSIHGTAFRKKSAVAKKDQDGVVALANHIMLHLRRMLESIDMEPQFQLLSFEILDSNSSLSEHAHGVTSATEAAQKIRESWELDDGPLLNLIKYIEATGVFVAEGDFGSADIDGVTIRPPGINPVVVLNANRTADRKRFSLAHEYGHVILHPFFSDEMEKEANEFAAELLMPAKGILSDLKKHLTIRELGRLKLKWRISMAALIYRAKTLNTITNEKATSLYKEMNFHGYRKQEPDEFNIENEQGSLLSQLLQMHLDDLGYSFDELAEAFRTFPNEVAEMYGLKQPAERRKLKLVIGGKL